MNNRPEKRHDQRCKKTHSQDLFRCHKINLRRAGSPDKERIKIRIVICKEKIRPFHVGQLIKRVAEFHPQKRHCEKTTDAEYYPVKSIRVHLIFLQYIRMPQGLGTGQLFTDNIPMSLEIRGDSLFLV